MRKKLRFLVICVALVLTSCERDAQIESINSRDISNDTFVVQGRSPIDETCCSEESLFERQMHWFSFISAEISILDPKVRDELKAYLLHNGGSSITAAELIGPDTHNPIFDQAFYNRLHLYINGPGHPNTSSNTPPHPIDPGPTGGLVSGNDVDAYIAALLNENCVELYFPNGLNFRAIFPSITATSHPLTSSNANEGIAFKYDMSIGGYDVQETIVNPLYVEIVKNVFVARPFRTTFQSSPGVICGYDEYSSIHFPDFLD